MWGHADVSAEDVTDGTYEGEHAWDDETPSDVVVTVVAVLRDEDPTDLPPLGEAVDPDALDRMFDRDADSEVRVGFAFAGYDVLARADGRVRVEPTADSG